jgi:hypothetical protein
MSRASDAGEHEWERGSEVRDEHDALCFDLRDVAIAGGQALDRGERLAAARTALAARRLRELVGLGRQCRRRSRRRDEPRSRFVCIEGQELFRDVAARPP